MRASRRNRPHAAGAGWLGAPTGGLLSLSLVLAEANAMARQVQSWRAIIVLSPSSSLA